MFVYSRTTGRRCNPTNGIIPEANNRFHHPRTKESPITRDGPTRTMCIACISSGHRIQCNRIDTWISYEWKTSAANLSVGANPGSFNLNYSRHSFAFEFERCHARCGKICTFSEKQWEVVKLKCIALWCRWRAGGKMNASERKCSTGERNGFVDVLGEKLKGKVRYKYTWGEKETLKCHVLTLSFIYFWTQFLMLSCCSDALKCH